MVQQTAGCDRFNCASLGKLYSPGTSWYSPGRPSLGRTGSRPRNPSMVYAYIEITPYHFIKCETDKATGYLLVDRPQRTCYR